MPEVTVLRVEFQEPVEKNESSLLKNDKSRNSSLVAGLVGGAVATIGDDDGVTIGGEDFSKSTILGTNLTRFRQRTREQRRFTRKLAIKSFRDGESKTQATKQFVGNISGPTIAATATAASAGAAAYSLYSNYKQSGLELTGATHAASVQARKGQFANEAIGLGVAIMINPVLSAPMIAMKAWNLAQTNRKELYEMRETQITSEILQRNLVKNVAERRF